MVGQLFYLQDNEICPLQPDTYEQFWQYTHVFETILPDSNWLILMYQPERSLLVNEAGQPLLIDFSDMLETDQEIARRILAYLNEPSIYFPMRELFKQFGDMQAQNPFANPLKRIWAYAINYVLNAQILVMVARPQISDSLNDAIDYLREKYPHASLYAVNE